MDYVQFYSPMVRGLVNRFCENPQTREELYQDAMMKVHIRFQTVKAGESFFTEDWKRRIHRTVKNYLIENYRYRQRRRVEETTEDLEDFTIHREDSYQFAIKELSRLLPELENKILNELLTPSPELQMYRARERVCCALTKKLQGLNFKPSEEELDPAMMGYFNIDKKRFQEALYTIRETFRKNF